MDLDKTVKIYGHGWVGQSMQKLFPKAGVHDPDRGLTFNGKANIAFVCVPTPLKDGRLDIHIVENIVENSTDDLIVIRSTVNPGDCQRLADTYYQRIVYQPEYLGETPNHPLLDPHARPFMVLGGQPEDRREVIDLYATVYNANVTIRQLSLVEAEVVKLAENRAIAFKVMQMHELYLACEYAGIDYYTIRDAVYGDDPRFNLWFTFIYNQLGFESSKCLSKDVPAFVGWCKDNGFHAEATQALINLSKYYAEL